MPEDYDKRYDEEGDEEDIGLDELETEEDDDE
jgi:hypothetical protein